MTIFVLINMSLATSGPNKLNDVLHSSVYSYLWITVTIISLKSKNLFIIIRVFYHSDNNNNNNLLT